MTFIQVQSNQPSPNESIFVFSLNQTCPCNHCDFLAHGAYTIDSSDLSESPEPVGCYQPTNQDELIAVEAKKNRQKVLIPNSWAYQTVSTQDMKQLGIYEKWRNITLKSPPQRHQITWELLNFLSDEENKLKIDFPNESSLIFPLVPLKLKRELKFL